MNNKKYLVLLFILSILITSIKTYYVDAEENNNVINVSNEVYLNSSIDISININKIEYDKFIFKLESNNTLDNIELTNDETIDLNVDNDSLTFEYTKDNGNLNELVLKYNLPANSKIGDKITYNISIINSENEEEFITFEKEINIVEQKQDNKSNTQNNDLDKNTNREQINQSNNQSMSTRTNMSNSQNKSQTQNKQTTNQSANNIVKVTYNGSDNNYLKSLSISGYKLNKDFSKDNTTYFVTVPDKTTKLTIKATSEDSDSVIKINGNDNLSTGLNKILVTVYAENGNTRVYRIYVTVGENNE